MSDRPLPEIKPCDICHSVELVINERGKHWVVCVCPIGEKGPKRKTSRGAIDAWNRGMRT